MGKIPCWRGLCVFDLAAESEQLKSAWGQYPAEFLDSYLVHGVENPCFNPQSVTLRALIIDTLFPGQFAGLMAQERLYSACACTLLLALAERRFHHLTEALESDPASAEAQALPAFLRDLRTKPGDLPFTVQSVWLQIFQAAVARQPGFISPLEKPWRDALGAHDVNTIKLLETACGSANDYRYFERYGLARAIDYTGVDLSPANIANARRRCPAAAFQEADAMNLPFADRSFDFYLTCDLFEHLSIAGFERALREAVRVTRRGLWLSFFQLEERPDHEIIVDPPYHRNVLSQERTLAFLRDLGCGARVLDLPRAWSAEFPGYRHYNPRGRIIEARLA